MSDFDVKRAMAEGCVTGDGRKARILCDDLKSKFPIAAVIEDKAGNELVWTFQEDGRHNWIAYTADSDLFNLPRKRYTVISLDYFGGQAVATSDWRTREKAEEILARYEDRGLGIFEWEGS